MPSQKTQADPVAQFHKVRTELLRECRGNVREATRELLRHRRLHSRFVEAMKTTALRR